MRKYLIVAAVSALFLTPAIARANFVLDASLGKGGQVSPEPRAWEQLNLQLAPGWGPSLPVLSMFRLQLGVVMAFADTKGSRSNMELRPMLSIVPPILPLYGRVIFAVNNLWGRDGIKREIAYGGAAGLRIGIPSIGIVPAFGVFAEAGLLPRSRASKLTWVVEGRAGAYLEF